MRLMRRLGHAARAGVTGTYKFHGTRITLLFVAIFAPRKTLPTRPPMTVQTRTWRRLRRRRTADNGLALEAAFIASSTTTSSSSSSPPSPSSSSSPSPHPPHRSSCCLCRDGTPLQVQPMSRRSHWTLRRVFCIKERPPRPLATSCHGPPRRAPPQPCGAPAAVEGPLRARIESTHSIEHSLSASPSSSTTLSSYKSRVGEPAVHRGERTE